ncbi:MAG: hypothetical protein LBJ00_01285 [Planctomycetaceae bacterium]|nr:hypothetical protein [Planctomycetaceae bacterium]
MFKGEAYRPYQRQHKKESATSNIFKRYNFNSQKTLLHKKIEPATIESN